MKAGFRKEVETRGTDGASVELGWARARSVLNAVLKFEFGDRQVNDDC